MKKLFFILITLMVFAPACKNQKQVIKSKTHETTDSTVVRSVNINDMQHTQNQSKFDLDFHEQIKDNSIVKITITERFKIDSTGNLDIEKQTVINKQNDIQKHREATAENITHSAITRVKDSSENLQIDLSKKFDKEVITIEKSKMSAWLSIVIPLVIILLILAFFWLLKKN